jgi:hypothetical protein
VYCSRCTNGEQKRGHRRVNEDSIHECAEDDYGDESGPDSIYRGQHDHPEK